MTSHRRVAFLNLSKVTSETSHQCIAASWSHITEHGATNDMESAANVEEGSAEPASPQNYARKPLSCSTCRIKKIRCDKCMPCCHCVKANIRCTFPVQRKPRERKPHLKNRLPGERKVAEAVGDALGDRLQSLEAQVSSLQTQLVDASKGDKAPPPNYELVKRTALRPHASSTGAGSHIKSSFWASINSEVSYLSIAFSDGSLNKCIFSYKSSSHHGAQKAYSCSFSTVRWQGPAFLRKISPMSLCSCSSRFKDCDILSITHRKRTSCSSGMFSKKTLSPW